MEETKSAHVAARLTPSQRGKLERLSAESGMSMSEVLGRLVEGAAVQKRAYIVFGAGNANRGAVEVEAQRAAVAA